MRGSMVHLSEIASTIGEDVFLTDRARVDVHGAVVFVTVERAEATARVDVPTAPREFCVFCSFEQFHGPW